MIWARFQLMQDNRPIQRGLTRARAEQLAKEREHGYRTHSDSDKRRVPHFWVREDPTVTAIDNWNYARYKEGERLTWET